MSKPINLKALLLRVLTIQTFKVREQYLYEKAQMEDAKEKKVRSLWSKELGNEVDLFLRIVDRIFEVNGKTAEILGKKGADGVEEGDEDVDLDGQAFSAEELSAADELMQKIAKK